MKILITDDNGGVREALRDMIECILRERKIQGTIKMAGNGSVAISMIEKEDFDIVISDLEMPYGNGWDVFRAIRVLKKNVKFVLCTGQILNNEDLEFLRKNGAYYLYKNILSIEDLKKVLTDNL